MAAITEPTNCPREQPSQHGTRPISQQLEHQRHRGMGSSSLYATTMRQREQQHPDTVTEHHDKAIGHIYTATECPDTVIGCSNTTMGYADRAISQQHQQQPTHPFYAVMIGAAIITMKPHEPREQHPAGQQPQITKAKACSKHP